MIFHLVLDDFDAKAEVVAVPERLCLLLRHPDAWGAHEDQDAEAALKLVELQTIHDNAPAR